MLVKRKIIFIHGFGVKKGFAHMFANISRPLEENEVESVVFDLNKLDDDGNIHVNPFSKQIEIIKEVFDKVTEDNSEGDIIDLVCHSQGCLVAAMADLPGIRKTIFLAPATENDNQKSLKYFSQNPKTIINPEGESRIAKRNGKSIVIPKEFFEEKAKVSVEEIYKEYTRKNNCVIFKANQDQVVSNENLKNLFEGSKVVELDGNHSFDGEARFEIVDSISRELL